MGRTTDSFRQVVCPDTGEAFANAAAAALAMQAAGWRATPEGVYDAIETGKPYCDHYFDWRYPRDWSHARIRAAGAHELTGAW